MNFLLNVKISYFLFFTYLKISQSTMSWKKNSPHIKKFFISSFSSTSPAIRMLKWVNVWLQFDNKVSTWFPELHRIERAGEFLFLIYLCSTKKIYFRLQTSLICKKEKKKTSCEKWLLGGVPQESFPKEFSKFTARSLFLALLKVFRPSCL